MRLCEHPDFDEAITRAAEYFRPRGLRAAIIEKDYYVSEALRILAEAYPGKILFKGGTSLSKGWNLIGRFSEDIDIFLDPTAYDPPLGKKAINRELKGMRDRIEAHPALQFVRQESQTIGGFGRNDRFRYDQKFGGPGEVAGRVFLEAGTASGREPTEEVRLRSYLGEFLEETGVSLGVEDEGSFPMRLLHFRRTFVEKLFAIHAKVEAFKTNNAPIGTYARHYYDLHCLASQERVRRMLASKEYEQIKEDYDAVSRQHFPKSYVPPPQMSFAQSDALFPEEALSQMLGQEYQGQCKVLCFGPYPSWEEVLTLFEEIRGLL